jgi:hypothetical protein
VLFTRRVRVASAWAPGRDAGSTGKAATTTSTLVPATSVPLGVYGGPGDPGSVDKFARRTGAKPSLGYLPASKGWSGMSEAGPLAPFIARGRAAGTASSSACR